MITLASMTKVFKSDIKCTIHKIKTWYIRPHKNYKVLLYRNPCKVEKIFASYKSDKGPESQIRKELSKLHS